MEQYDFELASKLEWLALSFAAGAHYGVGQKRKYTDEPYITSACRRRISSQRRPHTGDDCRGTSA